MLFSTSEKEALDNKNGFLSTIYSNFSSGGNQKQKREGPKRV